MSLLDLLTSLPGAPGTGFGPGPAIAGGLPAVGGASAPQCGPAPAPKTPSGLDHTPDPGYTEAPAPDTGDAVDAPTGDQSPDWSTEPYFHRGTGQELVSTWALDRYGDWVQTPVWWRPAKFVTLPIVLPIAAVATCAELTFRAPITFGGASFDTPVVR